MTKFNIDFAKCCYCQLCVFPCPTECIYMTDVYEFSEFQRKNLIYDFVTLTPQEREQKKLNYQKFEAEKAAEKAADEAVAKMTNSTAEKVAKETVQETAKEKRERIRAEKLAEKEAAKQKKAEEKAAKKKAKGKKR